MTISSVPQAPLDPTSLSHPHCWCSANGAAGTSMLAPIRMQPSRMWLVATLGPTSVFSRAINKIDRRDENYAFSLQVAVMHSCVVLTHLW